MINKFLIFFFSLLVLAGLFAPLMAPHDAQFYFERASNILSTTSPEHQWIYHWDLYSAKGDLSHAIRLNPNFTAAYTNRAAIEFIRGDLDAALKDCSSAIGLDPQEPNNYVMRGRVEMARREFGPALSDYGKAIALQPDNWRAYRGRMRVKEMQHDFAGAVMERVHMIEGEIRPFGDLDPTQNDFFPGSPDPWDDRLMQQIDRALETDTNFAWGYYYRGVTESLTNGWSDALADFHQCQNFPDDRLKDYAAIHIWLVQMQAGEREKADQGLLAYCQSRPKGTPADWQMQIAKFLLHQINETDFSNAMDPSDTGRERSEFWYYTGMKHLLANDKAGASERFRKSLASKTRTCAVFLSAIAELSALNPLTSDE